jgi:hypothetical protein
MLLLGFIALALALLAVIVGGTLLFIRIQNQSASQTQLQRVQADSCHVFQFVDQRFLAPTKTETAAQKQVTAEFAGQLHQAVADCVRAGYSVLPPR